MKDTTSYYYYYYYAWVCVCAAILLKLVIILVPGFHHVSLFEYDDIARNMLLGQGYGIENFHTWYRTFGSPPYSYLCFFIYFVLGYSHFPILFLQTIFTGITALCCFGIGSRLYSPPVGGIAAVLVSFHPGLFYYDITNLHPLSFDAALAASSLLMILALRKTQALGVAALCGFLQGIAVLERSTFVFLVPLTLLSIWLSRKQGGFYRRALFYCLMFSIIPGVWFVRNYLQYHRAVFVTTTGAEVLWRGNNPYASGGAYAAGHPGQSVFSATPKEFQDRIMGQDELVQQDIFSKEAKSFMLHHPRETVKLFFKKLFIFLWFSPQTGFLYPQIYLTLYKIYYSIMLFFALGGIFLSPKKKKIRNHQEVWTVLVFMASVAALQAIFYVDLRHRWGIEPLLLIFTAEGIFLTMKLFHRFFTDRSAI